MSQKYGSHHYSWGVTIATFQDVQQQLAISKLTVDMSGLKLEHTVWMRASVQRLITLPPPC